MSRPWRDRLADPGNRHDLLVLVALCVVVAIMALATCERAAKASVTGCPDCRAWHRWGAGWKRQALRLRAAQAGRAWHTATASTYFEPQAIAGPGGYYRGAADRRYLVAHRSLPFRTRVQFAYRGRTCGGVVLDRGPFVAGRSFDLGYRVARALGFGGVGTIRWRVVRL